MGLLTRHLHALFFLRKELVHKIITVAIPSIPESYQFVLIMYFDGSLAFR